MPLCQTCNQEIQPRPRESKVALEKRKFCSKECKDKSATGKPRTLYGVPRKLCSICGKPTQYRENMPNVVWVSCGDPVCRDKVNQLRIADASKTHKDLYAIGGRPRMVDNWNKLSNISKEELLLTPWLESEGWITQYLFRTNLPRGEPLHYKLDFALPDRKLYIEIDGSVHKHQSRKDRDDLKDSILKSHGWRGLRITSNSVNQNIDLVKDNIAKFITN